jgi:hypothetical protein
MSENHKVPLNLSRHQYGTLKFIHEHEVTLAYLKKAHANTLGSLAYRGYLRKVGSGEMAQVFLTEEGIGVLKLYKEAAMNERQHEHELTERCLRLIQHSRRIAVMSKSA